MKEIMMNTHEEAGDGIHGMVPYEKMDYSVRKLRKTYAVTPNTPFVQREFGYYCLDRWHEQGLPEDVDLDEYFGYDSPANYMLNQLGWVRPPFLPPFEEKIIEDRGDHEVVQDEAGRHILFFKNRRTGFMPTYLRHPVNDMKTWEDNCKWRLNPDTADRYVDLEARMVEAKKVAGRGLMMVQNLIGGYMYLRSLMGPEQLLYFFYDAPKLIHECMQTWFELADAVISIHQQYVTIDELFIAEDICYKQGSLISPQMIWEFLFPYYQQLIDNIKSRQIDDSRHLYFQVDTDGYAPAVLPLYRDIGMDVMSPFEVAAGCDVVAIGEKYPDLVIIGGVDKREIAKGPNAIDRVIDSIFPAMYKRGGYIPTFDHGVPEEVSLEDYIYFRKRCLEFAG
jgi:uroporphyrinogen decarboxylase